MSSSDSVAIRYNTPPRKTKLLDPYYAPSKKKRFNEDNTFLPILPLKRCVVACYCKECKKKNLCNNKPESGYTICDICIKNYHDNSPSDED
jgi:hypothetical protein